MNRGRIKWDDIKTIDVPLRDDNDSSSLHAAVEALEALWEARKQFAGISSARLGQLVEDLKLDGDAARIRWLAYKPPE